MDLKLKDKVVLVTGGIGTAIVKAFLGEGAKVAFSSTSQKKIDDLIPTLGAAPGQVAGFVADLNKEEDIKNFVEQAKARFGDSMTHEEAMAMLASNYAMDKRYAKPEEVANAALYLASEVSAHTAGMGMHVDSKVSPTS